MAIWERVLIGLWTSVPSLPLYLQPSSLMPASRALILGDILYVMTMSLRGLRYYSYSSPSDTNTLASTFTIVSDPDDALIFALPISTFRNLLLEDARPSLCFCSLPSNAPLVTVAPCISALVSNPMVYAASALLTSVLRFTASNHLSKHFCSARFVYHIPGLKPSKAGQ